jgi:hypothetical protein
MFWTAHDCEFSETIADDEFVLVVWMSDQITSLAVTAEIN